MSYNGPERRQHVQLSDEDFEKLFQRLKKFAKDELLIELGTTYLSQIRWVLRIVVLTGTAWATWWVAQHGNKP